MSQILNKQLYMKSEILSFNWKIIFDRTIEERKLGYDLMYSNGIEIFMNASTKCKFGYFLDILFEKGEFTFELNGEIHSLTSPTAIIVQPNSEFKFISCNNCSIHTIVVSPNLRNNLLESFIKNASIHSKMKIQPLCSIENEKDLMEFMNYLDAVKNILANTNNPYRMEAFKHFNAYHYYYFFFKFYNLNPTNDYGRCNHFFDLLDIHYLEERKSEFYAKKLSISVGHLDFLLKEKISKTAKNCIDEKIANESKKLLLETELSIENIATIMGFSNVVNFSRFFKRVIGESPRNFRQ